MPTVGTGGFFGRLRALVRCEPDPVVWLAAGRCTSRTTTSATNPRMARARRTPRRGGRRAGPFGPGPLRLLPPPPPPPPSSPRSPGGPPGGAPDARRAPPWRLLRAGGGPVRAPFGPPLAAAGRAARSPLAGRSGTAGSLVWPA